MRFAFWEIAQIISIMKYMLGIMVCIAMSGYQITAQSKEAKHEQRKENADTAFKAISELVLNGSYQFVADRTIPTGGTSISLVTNSNHIKLQDGKADIYLPYFGVIYSGAGYNHEAGIKFKGQVDEYTIAAEDGKRRLTITFDVKNGIEVHTFRIAVGKRGYASVFVRSSGRNSITYDGYIKSTEDRVN